MLFAASGVLSNLFEIGFLVAIVFVVATVGKRHRPDVYRWLLASAVGALVWTVLVDVLYFVLPRLIDQTETLLSAFSGLALLGIAAHAVLSLLVIRGFVAIAQPPVQAPTEPVGPYR